MTQLVRRIQKLSSGIRRIQEETGNTLALPAADDYTAMTGFLTPYEAPRGITFALASSHALTESGDITVQVTIGNFSGDPSDYYIGCYSFTDTYYGMKRVDAVYADPESPAPYQLLAADVAAGSVSISRNVPANAVNGAVKIVRLEKKGTERTIISISASASPNTAWIKVSGDQTADYTYNTLLWIQGTTVNNNNYRVLRSELDGGDTKIILRDPYIASVSYAVAVVNQTWDYFEVVGDHRSDFPLGETFTISGSTGNDGDYTLADKVFTGGNTRLTVNEEIPDATADGNLESALGTVIAVTAEAEAYNNLGRPVSYYVPRDDISQDGLFEILGYRLFSYDYALFFQAAISKGDTTLADQCASNMMAMEYPLADAGEHSGDDGLIAFSYYTHGHSQAAATDKLLGVNPYFRTGAFMWCVYAEARYCSVFPSGTHTTALKTAIVRQLDAAIDTFLVNDATDNPLQHNLFRGGKGQYDIWDENYTWHPDTILKWTGVEHQIGAYWALVEAERLGLVTASTILTGRGDTYGDLADDIYAKLIGNADTGSGTWLKSLGRSCQAISGFDVVQLVDATDDVYVRGDVTGLVNIGDTIYLSESSIDQVLTVTAVTYDILTEISSGSVVDDVYYLVQEVTGGAYITYDGIQYSDGERFGGRGGVTTWTATGTVTVHVIKTKIEVSEDLGGDAGAAAGATIEGTITIPDKCAALDTLSWLIPILVKNRNFDYAEQAIQYIQRWYKVFDENNPRMVGYKPYLAEVQDIPALSPYCYPASKDVVWWEGTFGVIWAFIALGMDKAAASAMRQAMEGREDDGYFYTNFVNDAYEMQNWKSLASTASAYLTQNLNGFWELDTTLANFHWAYALRKKRPQIAINFGADTDKFYGSRNFTPDFDIANSDATLLGWVWLPVGGNVLNSVLSTVGGGDDFEYVFWLGGGVVALSTRYSGVFVDTNTNFAFTFNRWHHVVWIRTGTTAVFYIDGIQHAPADPTKVLHRSASYYPNTDIYVGAREMDSLANIEGYLADLRFYVGTAFTAAQVAQARAGSYPTTNLVSHWPLNKTNVFQDEVGGFDLTVTGTPLPVHPRPPGAY